MQALGMRPTPRLERRLADAATEMAKGDVTVGIQVAYIVMACGVMAEADVTVGIQVTRADGMT